MAKPTTPPGLDPVNYPVLEGSETFAGSDVDALIIFPDDEERLRMVETYLNEVARLIEEGEDVSLSDAEDRAISNLPVSQSTENFLHLLNLQSITTSTFRNKSQVRALGQVNPRGFARGSRTIGGTMILTEFNRDVFWNLLKNNAPMNDQNVGDVGARVLVDQLAPFNMVLLFQHEYGAVAYRQIYGIEIVTNGNVYSIQDMYHENTLSFLCQDVTPLTPLEGVKGQLDTWRDRAGKIGNRPGLTLVPPRIASLASIQNGRSIVQNYRLRKNSRDPLK